MKNIINGKRLIAAVVFAFISPACEAEELVMIRPDDEIGIPKAMNAKVGSEGGIPCIALQVPHSGGGYVSVSCGKSIKVSDKDAITKMQAEAKKLGD